MTATHFMAAMRTDTLIIRFISSRRHKRLRAGYVDALHDECVDCRL
jgi:hypothetical protein